MAMPAGSRPSVGRIGIWSWELRFLPAAVAAPAAAEIESLGFGAIWVPGGIDSDLFERIDPLLAATQSITFATGIINIYKQTPEEVAGWYHALAPKDRSRVLLGLGVSHGPAIGAAYGKPLPAMKAYLDRLDAAGVPKEAMCLAALGPKMLELSRDRTAGAHPYLTTAEHTATARRILGPKALLAPEQGVMFETDPDRARTALAAALKMYLGLPNYLDNWRRLGFTDADFAGPSPRLLDALFAWGDIAAIKARAEAHLQAGADHVCLQVVQSRDAGGAPPVAAWRALAGALLTKA